ncbi:2-methylcitrate dehydratase PrpD [Lentibacillus halodurans]|uniref:2-methylcitrate dehydratase PrpD n=1 Tax=Lentibacillus halodurans TaxID=237679 RepID=A0A1I0XNW4_9BACI|nr:MmgE/PrpD family protein [Lentibacillus halodurans]SFB02662.1 2-methylcitrate dehydratase PrpD [Lentibacillus halodurans]
MNLSEKLANYIINTNYDDLPEDVVEFTKLCMLDYFGSAIAGSKKEPIQKIDELVREMGGKSQASLITGGRSSVYQSALLNGASSHIVEQDDIHKESIIHAATVVIPAALAVAEWKNLSGKDLINAVVVGYEVSYRIGEAVSSSHYYYWHNTATCGTFGSAAAVAKLLELSKEQIVHTLGNAGTQAAGLWEFIEDGAMSKQLHPGKAAMNGLISALLAEKDFTSAQKILEGKRGFFEAMSEGYNVSKITDNLGDEYKILENSFKIHASCRHTHHSIDLMIELANERDIKLEDIDRIMVKTYQVAINITDNKKPVTQYESKFSLQFCTALALLKGQGNLEIFNENTLWDEDVRKLMSRVDVIADEEIDARYPSKWGAIVEVYLKTGETIRKETDYPKGDPENAVSKHELLQKFRRLGKTWSESDRERLSTMVLNLEQLGTVRNLLSLSKVT